MYKVKELRKMPKEELLSVLNSVIVDLMNLRIQLRFGSTSSGNVNNSGNLNNYRNKRKLIARIKTILKELELINK